MIVDKNLYITVTNGTVLLEKYNNSILSILQNVLPEVNDWQPWCLVPQPKGLWDDVTNHKKYPPCLEVDAMMVYDFDYCVYILIG